jgi:hypothetical protein
MLTGAKLNTTGSTKFSSTNSMKITHAMDGTTESVITYFMERWYPLQMTRPE